MQTRRYTGGYYFLTIHKKKIKRIPEFAVALTTKKTSAVKSTTTALQGSAGDLQQTPNTPTLFGNIDFSVKRKVFFQPRGPVFLSKKQQVIPAKRPEVARNMLQQTTPAKPDLNLSHALLTLLGSALLAIGILFLAAMNPLGYLFIGLSVVVGLVLVVQSVILVIDWFRQASKLQIFLLLFLMVLFYLMLFILLF